MVKESIKDKTKYYICEECGFKYKDRGTAQKCEEFCRKHKSCSLEITKYAIK